MKRYIKPVMDIHTMSLADVMMTSASAGTDSLGGGGSTNGQVTDADVKRRRGIFGSDGSEEANGIW